MRESKAIWLERVERWHRSGLPPAVFAAQEGVNANTLKHWAWMLRKKVGAAERFVEVSAGDVEASAADAFELELPGYRVKVPAAFEAANLERLLSVLESRR